MNKVNAPGTFITVLSSFGMFVAPLAGINAVDFWLVRRQQWRVPDFYRGKGESIYWFTAGLNWRAFAAWTLAVWPSFRKSGGGPPVVTACANYSQAGFIASTGAVKVSTGWDRCFSVTWLIGFCGAAVLYYVICHLAPPPGKPYETVLMENSMGDHLSGVSVPALEDKRPEPNIKSLGGAKSSGA